jgi:hypothetical protein
MSFPYEMAGLLTLLAGAGLWLDAMRARELARATAARACERAQVQFLDDTVALHRLRLRRDTAGQMRVERRYHFEFTDSHEHRYRGALTLHGRQVLDVSLGS